MSSTDWMPTTRPCRKCGEANVEYRVVTSFDEAHEDEEYNCKTCGYSWWIDGPDY